MRYKFSTNSEMKTWPHPIGRKGSVERRLKSVWEAAIDTIDVFHTEVERAIKDDARNLIDSITRVAVAEHEAISEIFRLMDMTNDILRPAERGRDGTVPTEYKGATETVDSVFNVAEQLIPDLAGRELERMAAMYKA